MTRKRRTATIMLHVEGELESRSLRLPLWLLRVLTVTGISVAALIVLAVVLYTPIARTAAQVPGLRAELERLSAENQQVGQLASQLRYAEDRYAQLRDMLGADVVPEPERVESDLLSARGLLARAPTAAVCYEPGPSPPRHWPLSIAGLITRGRVDAGSSAEVHEGLDIAVPTGTPVRAAGGGLVRQADSDPEYGLFVQVDHPNRFQSMYGHLSRLLVSSGDSVRAGQVIGLSGSTGRSTAPHLHIETLQDGRPVDPNTILTQECAHGNILVRGG